MGPQDFLCDFCRREWDGLSSMIEGHKGSLICGRCLTMAYRALVLEEGPAGAEGPVCLMCLEERKQSNWRSDAFEDAVICERCVRQAAQALAKDEDSGWTKPAKA